MTPSPLLFQGNPAETPGSPVDGIGTSDIRAPEVSREAIQAVLDRYGCDCPMRGRCEVCSGVGGRMRADFMELLRPSRPVTLEAYGESVRFNIEDFA